MLVEDILFIICGCAVIETIIHHINKKKKKQQKQQRAEITDEDKLRFILSKGWTLHEISIYGDSYFINNDVGLSMVSGRLLNEAYNTAVQLSNYEIIKEEVDILKEKGIEL